MPADADPLTVRAALSRVLHMQHSPQPQPQRQRAGAGIAEESTASFSAAAASALPINARTGTVFPLRFVQQGDGRLFSAVPMHGNGGGSSGGGGGDGTDRSEAASSAGSVDGGAAVRYSSGGAGAPPAPLPAGEAPLSASEAAYFRALAARRAQLDPVRAWAMCTGSSVAAVHDAAGGGLAAGGEPLMRVTPAVSVAAASAAASAFSSLASSPTAAAAAAAARLRGVLPGASLDTHAQRNAALAGAALRAGGASPLLLARPDGRAWTRVRGDSSAEEEEGAAR